MKKQLTKMDFWVLAVVLALIAGLFVKGRMMDQLPETDLYTYQMTLIDPEAGIAARILPGDMVVCEAGKQSVGTVTGVQTDGETVILTLQAEGFRIEGGFRTNVYDILPGFRQRFYTETVWWKGIITSVS